MWNAATVSETLHDAKYFGFSVPDISFDWKTLKTARDNYIHRLNNIYGKMLGNNKVEIINGFATFKDEKTILVRRRKEEGKEEEEEYSADHILIAVGGKPILPNIPGLERISPFSFFFLLFSIASFFLKLLFYFYFSSFSFLSFLSSSSFFL